MRIFCTYCSAHKSKETGEMPAIRRYLSERIVKVYHAAQELGVAFFILSGEFGLLAPDSPIPWYDHLLLPEEVTALATRLTGQLQANHISGIVYFTQSLAQESVVIPYHASLAAACTRVGLPFVAVDLDPHLSA